VPVDFPYSKAYPASCILVAMTNYTWAGLATYVAESLKHTPGKSPSEIKIEMHGNKTREHLDGVAKLQRGKAKKLKRNNLSVKISLSQKIELQKAISLASRESAWDRRGAALQRAFDVSMKYQDMYGDEASNQASAKLIFERLLEHTLNGVPTPPATPDRLRKATEDIICLLCDSGGSDDETRQNKKPAASSKKSSKTSSSLHKQNNKDEQNKDKERGCSRPRNRKQGGFF
jgi:hypothetical protein